MVKRIRAALTRRNRSIITSYMSLRNLIGWLGILLPVFCIIGGYFIKEHMIQGSISSYYYTNMRDFFVGVMFLVGLFLITYHGYDRLDTITFIIIGVFSLCVAIFPCFKADFKDRIGIFNLLPKVSNVFHVISASAFFVLLAFTSLFLFTKHGEKPITREKKNRNIIYIICGIVMLVTMIALVLLNLFGKDWIGQYPVVLIAEIILLWAFGISWLTKGQTIFPDKHPRSQD